MTSLSFFSDLDTLQCDTTLLVYIPQMFFVKSSFLSTLLPSAPFFGSARRCEMLMVIVDGVGFVHSVDNLVFVHDSITIILLDVSCLVCRIVCVSLT